MRVAPIQTLYCSWCLPQPASCFASIGKRAQWLRLDLLRTQWFRLNISLVWYNTISVWWNCMLISANTMASVRTKLNFRLFFIEVKSPYLKNLSKQWPNSRQKIMSDRRSHDDPLDHIITGSHDLNIRSYHL